MKRKAITGIIVIAIVLGATFAWRNLSSNEDAENATLTLYGNVEIRDARLAFSESEKVISVEVDEGASVTQGQVLARLRSDPLVAQKEQAVAQRNARAIALQRLKAGARVEEIAKAEAEVAAAEVHFANAQRELERAQLTSGSGASSKQSLDTAKATASIAKAELNVRKAALALVKEGPRKEDIAEAEANLAVADAVIAALEIRLSDTVLKAPSAGVIQSRLIETGEIASPSRTAFTLALTDPKWIRAYVSEPDLGHVSEEQAATVTSDSWPDKTFTGHVGFISPTAEFTPRSVETTDLRSSLVYEVRIWVDDTDNQLRLGMPATVELTR